jgi:hypothetical protein
MTYDGYHAAAAPGALVVLDRDLNVRDFVTFSVEAVDNSIAIDEQNGTTSSRLGEVEGALEWRVAVHRRKGRRVGIGLRMDATTSTSGWTGRQAN